MADGLVLMPNGTLSRWGNAGLILAIPESATNVVAMATGYRHCIAARNDGSVVCWGTTSYGRTAFPPEATNVVAVAGGEAHGAALRSDGTVVVWGQWFLVDPPAAVVPADLTNVVAISGWDNHLMCLIGDGTVRCFGANQYGQTEIPEGLNGVKAISAGGSHCLALRTNGAVIAWGEGYSSGETIWTGIKSIGAGWRHDLAVRNDGQVVARGNNNDNQANVPPGLTNVLAVGGGENYSVALIQSCAAPVLAPIQASPGLQVCAGTPVTLTQLVIGDSSGFNYQWLRNGTAIEGATTTSWTVEIPAASDQYECGVTSSCGASNASAAILLNLTPVANAADLVVARLAGVASEIVVVDEASAAAGVAVTAVGGGTAGATINFSGSKVFYTPAQSDGQDTFAYTLGTGACADTGTITVVVVAPGGRVRQIEPKQQGLVLRFAGEPGVTYTVQKSDSVQFTNVIDIQTIPSPANGIFEIVDPDPSGQAAYYRLKR